VEDLGSSLVRSYVTGRLAEIHAALTELDERPDACDRHARRAELVTQAARLTAALAALDAVPQHAN